MQKLVILYFTENGTFGILPASTTTVLSVSTTQKSLSTNSLFFLPHLWSSIPPLPPYILDLVSLIESSAALVSLLPSALTD